jgi:hypothetical protein
VLNIKLLRNLIVLAAALSVVLGIALLIWPSAALFGGDSERSAAVTSALALIVATLGLVLALHMQSAEYRRETDLVDGLQELRVLLEIMTARCALDRMHGPGADDPDVRSYAGFLEEKQLLLELLHQMPGRFLIYFSAVKHAQAKKSDVAEKWRLLHLHIAFIRRAPNAAECAQHIVGLLKLIREIGAQDISDHAKGFVSASSIDELNDYEGNIVIDAMVRQFDTAPVIGAEGADDVEADPFPDAAALENCIADLQALIGDDPDGAGALEELSVEFARAREGGIGARIMLHDMLGYLMARRQPPTSDE